MEDLISIIVPAYNIENYLERCVESIRCQTYKNLEIILVDDGSSDGTASLIQRMATRDDRIVAIYKKNGGVSSARMAGLKAATGDWIGFVDGDDFIESQMYEALIENARKYKADISHCGYQMVFPSRIDYYHNTEVLIEQDKEEGLVDLLSGQLVEPGLAGKLYCRRVINKFLKSVKMDFEIKNTEDLLMNYYLFKQAEKSVFIDKCYYHYILRRGSAATASMNIHKFKDPLTVLKLIEEDILSIDTKKDNGLLIVVQNRIAAQLATMATAPIKKDDTEIYMYKKIALKELRSRVPDVFGGTFSKKRKVLTIWAAFAPFTYQVVHRVYAKMTGIENKYSVR